MEFIFKPYEYQTKAAAAVCDVFKGQPYIDPLDYQRAQPRVKPTADGAIQGLLADAFTDIGYRNADVRLTDDDLLTNVRTVQKANQITPLTTELPAKTHGRIQLDVSMETGTGKTFVYTKTIFELNKRYGWSKFIIVVPSIAIREGVKQSLDNTKKYFFTSGVDGTVGYNKSINYFIYDSNRLTDLDHFASSSDIEVMIINMQAFNTSVKAGGSSKAARIIFSERDDFGSRKPIEVIANTHPIVILDEPQKMGGKATQAGIDQFKPLFTIGYSATHRTKHVPVYDLDAVDAYNLRLVKRIEVHGIELEGMRGTDGYVRLLGIDVKPDRAPQARIEFKRVSATGTVSKTIKTFGEGDDLYPESGELEAYRDGYAIAPGGIVPPSDGGSTRTDAGADADGDSDTEAGVNAEPGHVRFLNGLQVQLGASINDSAETDLRRAQIRATIQAHLRKEEHLWNKGIKCLSLFFIDAVSKYRLYNTTNEPLNGEYATMFEDEYTRCVKQFISGRIGLDAKGGLSDDSSYINYLSRTLSNVHGVHSGYFSMDKHHHLTDSRIKRGEDISDDESAYDLILRDKERLLSFDEPVRFIFSHSALREGWDNPNVFQICTLKDSSNEISKRQEVGRGLRLCVDDNGVRQDEQTLGDEQLFLDVNTLTIVASESYEKFAADLQKDISQTLRERPTKIDDDFFAKLTVSATALGPQFATAPDPKFTSEESAIIHKHLYKADYLDDADRPTGKYTSGAISQDADFIADLPQSIRESPNKDALIAAIDYGLQSVVDGTTHYHVACATDEKIHDNRLNANWNKTQFQQLWRSINHKYAYTVEFDEHELVKNCVNAINDSLTVTEPTYTITRGTQQDTMNKSDVDAGSAMHIIAKSARKSLDVAPVTNVTYDLLGEIAEAGAVTRRCAAEILSGIRPDKFAMFRTNPEQFIAKVGAIVRQQKAAQVVESIVYHTTEGTYDPSIFMTGGNNNRPKADAVSTRKCVQHWVFPDGDVEHKFTDSLENGEEVDVYAKLPRGFQIPTPVGNYAPDWAIVLKDPKSSSRHLFFVAETKGSMETMDLRGVENNKIECAKRLYNSLKLDGDNVHYEKVANYTDLLNAMDTCAQPAD